MTVTQAAQTNITSLGTLTALTVDDVAINGKVVTMTGSTDDTATVTVGTNGTLAITTVDTAAAAANMTLTADGTFEAVGTTITLDSGGAINLEPASGSAILLDGTISVDAGVVTGATSITSTAFVGALTGNVTGNASGTALTVTQAAQTNITSLGTLTALTVDDVAINGKVVTMTGSSSDTAVFTAGTNGTLSIVTTDDAAAAANIQITADGTVDIDSAGVLTLDSGAAINIEPAAGSAILLDGTISIDAGVVTGATSITSTAFVGDITGDVTGTSSKATVTDSTANTNFPVVFHNESDGLLDDTGALRYNPSTGELLVPKLTVAGTTTTVDTVTMQAENAIIFEGATADAYETTLSIVDPTADHTQYLINQGGYIPVLAASTTTAISSTPAELNILDGATVVVGEINSLDLGSTAVGTAIASKAVILDSSKDYTGLRNLTITGELDAATLDISGAIDVAGTSNLDVVDIDGAVDMASTLAVAGVTTLATHLVMGDSDIIKLGAGADLQIYHDGSHSFVRNTTGNMYLQDDTYVEIGSASGEVYIGAVKDGAVNIRYDNSAKLATVTGGVNITGDTDTDTLTVSGNATVGGTLGVTGVLTGTTAVFNSSSADDNLVITSTDADAGDAAPDLVLYRNSSSPADGDDTGRIEFRSRNDNSQDIVGASIQCWTNDVSDGSEDSQLGMYTLVGGATKGRMLFTQTETHFNHDSADLDFKVEGDSDANLLFVDAGNDRVGIGTSSPSALLDVDGTLDTTNLTIATAQGSDGQVLTSTGSGVGWEDASGGGASDIDGLSDCLVETDSIYLGNDPSGSTSTAEYNVAVGLTALDAISTGDHNTAVGSYALSLLNSGSDNTAFGSGALDAATGANYNTAFGRNALGDNTASGNTAFGRECMGGNVSGTENTAVGNGALGVATGHYHTAVGSGALGSNTGSGNTGIGRTALNAAGAGSQNTAVGQNTLAVNTSGGYQVAVGYGALDSNLTTHNSVAVGASALGANIATENVAVGYTAGSAITTGIQHTCIGANAGNNCITANSSTSVGYNALTAATSGLNTAVGASAGDGITTGSSNTLIGAECDTSAVGSTHQIVMGSGAIGGANNQFTFGKASNLVQNEFDTDAAWTRTSDVRKKRDIKDDTLGLEFINDLRTVTHKWKPSNEFPEEWTEYSQENNMNLDAVMHGMIAQEVKEALDKAGVDTFTGWEERSDGSQTVSREMFVMPLIKAVQELSAEVEELKSKLEE